ncbi:type IV pilus modification protein PilV [Rhodanobacter sp. OK091]|uniref:type IV pilus modification protein PilV n=1 Tax=Rhodanobacter sp. OK091 TaxID=1881037 RepID=UPI00092009BC|nr:type IV pilus modification protein PilV [Rhodanobacter sp. OK091]SHM06067.1 type IV pilus assembly protein PilV [Rhodanobacter sp. OK091]
MMNRAIPASAQSGAGLIEVLVAVLVLSIAFLGIAALQAMSLSTNNSAMARSMVTVASYSILDAMRADLSNAANHGYDGAVTANACAAPAGASALASAQLVQWCGELGQTLGASANTTGTILCNAAAGTTTAYCIITVQFDDSRAGVGGTNKQKIVTQAML